jgi:hypothetical protein
VTVTVDHRVVQARTDLCGRVMTSAHVGSSPGQPVDTTCGGSGRQHSPGSPARQGGCFGERDGPKPVTERRVGQNVVRRVAPVASVDNVAL